MQTATRGRVTTLVGAQYGSEGKGVIAAKIADKFDIHVRTGGPNAGHSFKYKGETHVQQIVPCGWINPNAKLIIGAGMLLDMAQLRREIEIIKQHDPNILDRLWIDMHAGVLDAKFIAEEGGTEGEIHKRIGSTGHGVGAAREARMHRDPKNFQLVNHLGLDELGDLDKCVISTPPMMNSWVQNGQDMLLEGTQGSGLSLIHGPWPYVTSHDTNSAQLCADAGIPGRWIDEVILVARTFPIRVAGNSGPLEHELDWDKISERMGRKTEERTTVTKKVRRIGAWDDSLFLRACWLNAPTQIALTFMDYLSPTDEGKTDYDRLTQVSKRFVRYVEQMAGCRVKYVSTGGPDWAVINRK